MVADEVHQLAERTRLSEQSEQVRQHIHEILDRIVHVSQQVQTQSVTSEELPTAIKGIRTMAEAMIRKSISCWTRRATCERNPKRWMGH